MLLLAVSRTLFLLVLCCALLLPLWLLRVCLGRTILQLVLLLLPLLLWLLSLVAAWQRLGKLNLQLVLLLLPLLAAAGSSFQSAECA